jgi:ribose transport system permease protein
VTEATGGAGGGRRADLPAYAWTYAIFAGLLLLAAVFAPSMLGGSALVSTLTFAVILCVASLGLTITLIVGGIDLSLPYTITFSAMSYLSLAGTLGEEGAMAATLLIGLAIGVFNGLGITLLRIHPIVMTVATNGILLGLIQLVFSVTMITSDTPILQALTIHPIEVLGLRIPSVVLVGLVVIVATQAMLSLTGYGRMIFLLGASRDVARYTGLRVNAIEISVYGLAAVLNAVAGVLIAGYFRQTALGMGDPYLLAAVSAVIVGGASIYGGKGSVQGTFGGALVLTQLTSLLTAFNIGTFWQQSLYGAIILVMAILYNRDDRLSN